MLKATIAILFFIPFIATAQTDVLILKKRGKQIRTYTVGDALTIQTVYDQDFKGKITAMRRDSVFLDNRPWHYKEIANIQRVRIRSGFLMIGTGMMAAGGGFLVLSAVNGLYRGDQFKDWYTTAGLITSGALIIGGYILRKSFYVKYKIGKKYTLEYMHVPGSDANNN